MIACLILDSRQNPGIERHLSPEMIACLILDSRQNWDLTEDTLEK